MPLPKCTQNVNFGHFLGCRPSDGVPDMIVISGIDETGINENLRTRYKKDQIYVSLLTKPVDLVMS